MFRSLHLRFSLVLIGLLFGLALLPASVPAEQNVNPGINQHYQDPDYERWVRIFEHPGREVYDKRREIVAALDLQPGMSVADIGAGTGLFTRLFARQVGDTGKVYAVDIAENFIDNVLRTSREQGLNNVEGIVNDQHATHLPQNAVDVAFICDTYHHFEYPHSMLASIRQALRSNGKLVIIDFRKQPGDSSPWVMGHVRANRQTVIHEVQTAGFRLSQEPEILDSNYFLIFDRN
jgi:ubiquinone/menaquinone biosynthesis C-methylase UbiE